MTLGHVQPVRADAGLAGVEELEGGRALCRTHRIGIGEHDERRMAAEFDRHPLQVASRPAGQHPAHRRRTGEGDLAHTGVVGEHLADRTGITGRDHVDDTGRDAGIDQHVEDCLRAQRSVLGRFEHQRAPRSECWTHLAGQHRHRVVPRCHHRHDADGLTHDEETLIGTLRGQPLADDPRRLLGVVPQEVGRVVHLVARRLQRFALFARHQAGDLVGPLPHQAPGGEQQVGPLTRRRRGPGREC